MISVREMDQLGSTSSAVESAQPDSMSSVPEGGMETAVEYGSIDFTNQEVIDMLDAIGEKAASERLMILHERAIGDEHKPMPGTYVKSMKSLQKKYKDLKKNSRRPAGKEKMQEWLDQLYQYPKADLRQQNQPKRVKEASMTGDTEIYKGLVQDLTTELTKTETELLGKEGELNTAQKEIQQLQRKTAADFERLNEKSRELKQTRSREAYQRQKAQKLEMSLESSRASECEISSKAAETERDALRKVKSLENELSRVKAERDLLHDQLMEKGVLNLFDEKERKWTPDLLKCVYTMLDHHVGFQHVAPVIEACLQLAGKTANRLPKSTSTVYEMNIQRRHLAARQIGEEYAEKPGTTLCTDETTKLSHKYGGYHGRDKEGKMYVLGLRELVTKSAKDTLDTLKEILEDVDRCCEKSTNEASRKILTNISCTMSDRAATEMKFNVILEEYRNTVLPQTVANYNSLNEEEQQALGRLSNFFCGLHSLVHMAETAQAALEEAENAFFGGSVPSHGFVKKNEPGTTRLVREACKAFARGNDKSGCYGQFKSYTKEFLHQNNLRTMPLQQYRGNRFNILFSNAGHVFFLHKKMVDFLENYPKKNLLLQSVSHGLGQTFFLAGLKALGLVSKLVTTPLWNLIEDESIHVLDMNKWYESLIQYLKTASENTSTFITGELLPFDSEVDIKTDAVYESLVTPWEYDDQVEVILSVMLPALAKLCEKLFSDQLPGGTFHQFSDDEVSVEKTKSAPKHNKFAERVFAYQDHLLKSRPNVSSLASEAYIMFTLNRTGAWLASKSETEQNKLINDARRQMKSTLKQFKAKQQEIEKRRQDALVEKLQQAEVSRRKKLDDLEKQTDDMIHYGLWQSAEQVDRVLTAMDTVEEKVKALKCQLKFRKNVLKQEVEDKSCFVFSKAVGGKRVQLSWKELAGNLKKLVRKAADDPVPQSDTDYVFLIGKRVNHRFMTESDDGQTTSVWYTGKVISNVPGFPSWYNIIYDDAEEEEHVYTYQLLKDYQDGDLKIIK